MAKKERNDTANEKRKNGYHNGNASAGVLAITQIFEKRRRTIFLKFCPKFLTNYNCEREILSL